MTQIKKFAWYGSSVAFAALMAMALIVSTPVKTAEATGANEAVRSATVAAANDTATVTISYRAAAAGQVIQAVTTLGTFQNGQTSIQLAAASSTADAAGTQVTAPRVFVQLKSGTAGTATVQFNNLTAPAQVNTTVTFFGAPNLGANASTTGVELNTTFAAVTDRFKANAAMANGAYTVANTTHGVAGVPAVYVTATITQGGGNNDTPGTLAITGTAADGSAQTETLTLVAADTVTSRKAFATVTALTQAGHTINTGADSIQVGYVADRAGAANNTATANYANNTTIGLTTLSDSGGRAVGGASVTMTIDGDGIFTNTGGKTWIGQTNSSGTVTAQGITLPATGAMSATVTVQISSVMGDLTIVSKLARAGAVANIVLSRTATTGTLTGSLGPNAGNVIQTIRATVTDGAGNPVSGVSPTLTSSNPALATVGAFATASAAGTGHTGNAEITHVTGTGTVTITASHTVGSTTTTATIDIVIAGAGATLTIEGPTEIVTGGNGQFVATLRDANGNLAVQGAGNQITFAVTGGTSAGNAVVPSAAINLSAAGTATATVISGGVNGTFTVTAVGPNGTSAFQTFQVVTTVSTPPPAGDGEFTGTISPTGVSLVTFDGGSLADFQAAAMAAGAVSVWTTVDGAFVGYIPGAPAVVNAAFTAQFGTGVAAGTIVIIVK